MLASTGVSDATARIGRIAQERGQPLDIATTARRQIAEARHHKRGEVVERHLHPRRVAVDDGPPLVQSMAILEYLEETHPQPPLLPRDPRGRARVRGLALIVACEGHPLIVPRIRTYLEGEMRLDEPARNRWLQHWTRKALEALETHLAHERETGRFCHGTNRIGPGYGPVAVYV